MKANNQQSKSGIEKYIKEWRVKKERIQNKNKLKH
jgi:hypothetical protein